MPSSNLPQILIFLTLVVVIDTIIESNGTRKTWTWGKSRIVDVYQYISYELDFRALTRMNKATFRYICDELKPFMHFPKDFHHRVAYTDTPLNTTHLFNQYKHPLSPENRLLRHFMMAVGHRIRGLIHLFGQQKSTVYNEWHHISRLIQFALAPNWLHLPDPNSDEYSELLGLGVLSDSNGRTLFSNSPYIADVTSIRIRRPSRCQQEFYNGHKKYHTMDYHVVHDGDGIVRNISGPTRGHNNDIQQAKKCVLYTEPHRYLRPGHRCLADLAYYHIGYPYLCRIAYKTQYTAMEQAYNMDHSSARVISENYYSRWKVYWGLFQRPYAFSLDTIDASVRALCIITNIIIAKQSPLRAQ